MKSVKSIFGIGVASILLSVQAFAEGGLSGGGSDNVEPLFIKAQKDSASIVKKIAEVGLERTSISAPYKLWLSQNERVSRLYSYLKRIQLSFQEAPCYENDKPRGACFNNVDPERPIVIVSYIFNKKTTPEQATAMMIHEAGHFTGEMDHLFLSELGTELVSTPVEVKKPKYICYDLSKEKYRAEFGYATTNEINVMTEDRRAVVTLFLPDVYEGKRIIEYLNTLFQSAYRSKDKRYLGIDMSELNPWNQVKLVSDNECL